MNKFPLQPYRHYTSRAVIKCGSLMTRVCFILAAERTCNSLNFYLLKFNKRGAREQHNIIMMSIIWREQSSTLINLRHDIKKKLNCLLQMDIIYTLDYVFITTPTLKKRAPPQSHFLPFLWVERPPPPPRGLQIRLVRA